MKPVPGPGGMGPGVSSNEHTYTVISAWQFDSLKVTFVDQRKKMLNIFTSI